MKNLLIFIIAIGGLWVAYYLISPIFITVEIDEELPEGLVVSEPENLSNVPSGVEKLSVEEKEIMEKQEAEFADVVVDVADDMPEDMPEEVAEPMAFEIMYTRGHPAEGTVRVLETTDGTSIIRYEDFSTINGPQLNVYLAKDLEAREFVDLGPAKGTKGNINYEVPEGIDVSEYKYVMYWCVPFRVLFNYAEIN